MMSSTTTTPHTHRKSNAQRNGFTVVCTQTVRYEQVPDPAYPDRTDKFVFNYDNMLPPPRRTFSSRDEYMRWRIHVEDPKQTQNDFKHDDHNAFLD
jgi:hypothetical protein